MKLISCHIEGFGTIKKQDFVFDSRMTSFCEENGSGKTTLASFIKAMLYGLDSYKTNTKEFVDRKRYYPFDGGVFGGNAVLRCGDDEYKIERLFDEKSEARDKLTVYKNGNEITLDGRPGEFFFGMDEESFTRTAFISSDEIEISSTDGINAKLNNFVSGSEDFAAACERLEKERKKYKKSKQAKDLISVEKEKLNRIYANVENMRRVKEALYKKYEELEKIKSSIFETEKLLEEQNAAALLLKDWERVDDCLANAEESKKKAVAVAKKYPLGLPSEEEIENAKKAYDSARTLSDNLSKTVSDDRLSFFQKKFSVGIPSEEELSEAEELSNEILLIEKEIADCEKKIAENSAPCDAETLNSLENALSDYRDGSIKKGKSKFAVAAVLSAIVAAVGVGTLFFATLPGIIVIFVGISGLFLSAFLYLNEKTNLNRNGSSENELEKILLKNGTVPDGNVEYAAEAFISRMKEKSELSSLLYKKQKEFESAKEKSERFFEKYSLEKCSVSSLRSEISEYALLSRLHKENFDVKAKIEEDRKTVSFLCEKCGVPYENFEVLVEDVSQFFAAKTAYAEAVDAAKRIKEEKGLAERPEDVSEKIAHTENARRALVAQRESLLLAVDADESFVSGLEKEENSGAECVARIKEYERRVGILTETENMLRIADGNLKNKYILPVKDNFVKYASALEKAIGEKVTMSSDLSVSYERNGMNRSEKHLSSGQRSLCALCFRLALLENMFPKVKPFLILDDPFTSLDEAHLKKVKALLDALSGNFQLLYFTCHDSRNI